MGMAMDFPGASTVSGPRNRAQLSAPPRRVRPSAGGERGGGSGRLKKACHLPHLPPFLRHAPPRGRVRHPDDPGAAGTPRRQHHDDLHPRPQPWGAVRPKPDGRLEVTTPTAHHASSIPASPQPNATPLHYQIPPTTSYKATSNLTGRIPYNHRLPEITFMNLIEVGLSQST